MSYEKRIDAFIEVMKRVESVQLRMSNWQWSNSYSKIVVDEKTAHKCGTVCCAAGWLAISPEFIDAGGSVNELGAPIFKGIGDEYAVARYLGIPVTLAEGLTTVGAFWENAQLYPEGICRDDITPEHVVAALEKLKELRNSWNY